MEKTDPKNEAELAIQLKNRANFIGKNGNLYLVKCMMCPDAGELGTENYAMNVAHGVCTWCGWQSVTKCNRLKVG